MRPYLILVTLFVLLLIGIAMSPLINFHYRRFVKNDPLVAPQLVVLIRGSTLHLEDGRRVRMGAQAGWIKNQIAASGDRIDIEVDQETSCVTLYGSFTPAQCGDPFIIVRRLFPPYCIPLIADDFPMNERAQIGTGMIVSEPSSSDFGPSLTENIEYSGPRIND